MLNEETMDSFRLQIKRLERLCKQVEIECPSLSLMYHLYGLMEQLSNEVVAKQESCKENGSIKELSSDETTQSD